MRAAFISKLTELARLDPKIFLLTGDLGFRCLEEFAQEFPDQFLNVGVAEQNMIGVATGLAEAGFIPFAYSIVPFACLRPYEFIRNGPVMHQLQVRIVGMGGGFDYAHNGLTHYGLEDIAVMRAQPGMHVIVPADGPQTASALESTYNLNGPIYYRLERCAQQIAELHGKFSLDKSQVLSEGSDLLIICTGSIVTEAQKLVSEIKAQSGASCRLVLVSTLNPAPEPDLLQHLSQFSKIMTIESHYRTGGLGSLVAEVIADHGLNCKLIRNAVTEMPNGITGSRQFLEMSNGLDFGNLLEKYKSFELAKPVASIKCSQDNTPQFVRE